MAHHVLLATFIRRLLMGRLLWPGVFMLVLMVFITLFFQFFLAQTFQQHLSAKTTQFNLAQAEQQAQLLSARLAEVRRQAHYLQQTQQQFFQQPQAYPLPNGAPKFDVHKNGAFYKTHDNGGASLYYSATSAMTPARLAKARQTEVLDTGLKAVVESNPWVTQAYLATWDNMSRLYPFTPDLPRLLGGTMIMGDFNFYYLATAPFNPGRSAVWTRAYLDPAGRGAMVSCLVPIYKGDYLEGVTGLDLPLDGFINEVLAVPEMAALDVFLVDQEGALLSGNGRVETFFDQPSLDVEPSSLSGGGRDRSPARVNRNLSGSMLRQLLAEPLNQSLHLSTIEYQGQSYSIAQARIPETQWRLLIVSDVAPTFGVLELLQNFGSTLLVLFLLLALMLSAFVLLSCRRLCAVSLQLAKPVETLMGVAKGKETGREAINVAGSTIVEVEQIKQKLHKMAQELDSRTAKFVTEEAARSRSQQETERLRFTAARDPLTGLYNRRKIDEVLELEWRRVQRYGGVCSVMLIDLDYFKQINDEFGHLVGDEVLQVCAKLLRDRTRESDLVARWGGEEFMVICPETPPEAAALLAEKLRAAVAEKPLSGEQIQTASFGVAAFEHSSDSLESVLQQADDALYQAKSAGRNRVVLSGEFRFSETTLGCAD